jgi:UDP:flavonoid glycosyltransferase YjiC (YdhE family)
MKRVVFCTELGGNYGHISGFIKLSQYLVAQGCEVVFILRSLQFAHLLGSKAVCFQAPVPNFVPVRRDTYSYSGLLSSMGYNDESVLTEYLGMWRRLFESLKVDLVVADHAPTALLAAHSLNLHACAIGTGFVVPPAADKFPLFISGVPHSVDEMDAAVLSVVNKALAKFQSAPLITVGDIFNRSNQFLCTFPEMDHYGFRPDADYWGPLFSEDMAEIVDWPNDFEPKIFAYLTPKVRSLTLVLHALAQLPGCKLVHIPGFTLQDIAGYRHLDLKIISSPVNIKSVLSDASLVVSQGGAGLGSQCLLAGVRHVMIPTQTEQRMLARRMTAQGLVYAVDPEVGAPDYSLIFDRALACPVLGKNIAIMREKYAGFSQGEQLAALAEEMLSPLCS